MSDYLSLKSYSKRITHSPFASRNATHAPHKTYFVRYRPEETATLLVHLFKNLFVKVQETKDEPKTWGACVTTPVSHLNKLLFYTGWGSGLGKIQKTGVGPRPDSVFLWTPGPGPGLGSWSGPWNTIPQFKKRWDIPNSRQLLCAEPA